VATDDGSRVELPALRTRTAWVFDLDGTLTCAIHDFDAIREELGLAPAVPILETLASLPEGDAAPLYRRLDEIELALAARATTAPGTRALLSRLQGRGARLGVLTRNSVEVARATLRRCRLERYFDPDSVIGREQAEPKPSPAGIERLLGRWGTPPEEGVMVGDFLFDLQAGRAAGVATVYVDPTGGFPHGAHADVSIRHLDQIP
jgi:HAD superfamily hydrolase (TIGR01509 family)